MQLSSEDPEEGRTIFRNVAHSLAVDALGYTYRKHQDCCYENDEDI